MLKKIIAIVSITVSCDVNAQQRTMTVTGGTGTLTLNTTNGTIAKVVTAGSDYINDYLTATNYLTFSVTVPAVSSAWYQFQGAEVSVTQSTAWPNPLTINIAPTGSGNSSSNNSYIYTPNSNAFTEISTTSMWFMRVGRPLYFSSGAAFTHSNIPVRIKISGISVLVPVGTYNNTLTFTVSAP